MISGLKDKFNNLSGPEKQKIWVAVGLFVVLIFFVAFQVKQHFAGGGMTTSDAQNMAESQQGNLERANQQSDGQGSPQEGVSQDANDIYAQTLELQGAKPPKNMPIAANASANPSAGSEQDVSIMPKRLPKSEKMVLISVGDSGRSNPFLPAGENIVPSSLPKFNFSAPPEQAMTGSEADRVMKTTISGILYDKYSPSAIINISGTDYLVKKSDVINGYRVLTISKDQVVVQLGNNVYRAGVGQILAQGPMNYNVVSHLNKKFGGNDVAINVKKKKY